MRTTFISGNIHIKKISTTSQIEKLTQNLFLNGNEALRPYELHRAASWDTQNNIWKGISLCISDGTSVPWVDCIARNGLHIIITSYSDLAEIRNVIWEALTCLIESMIHTNAKPWGLIWYWILWISVHCPQRCSYSIKLVSFRLSIYEC